MTMLNPTRNNKVLVYIIVSYSFKYQNPLNPKPTTDLELEVPQP